MLAAHVDKLYKALGLCYSTYHSHQKRDLCLIILDHIIGCLMKLVPPNPGAPYGTLSACNIPQMVENDIGKYIQTDIMAA